MRDLGDRVLNPTIDFTFFTMNVSEVPTTLAGTPVVSVYKANSTTQTVAGVTLTPDFDGVTGLNHVRIVATDSFYATANDYNVVITAGIVNGASWVGRVIATFSIQNRRADITQINGSSTAAARLALSAARIVPGTVDTAVNGHTPTTTEFQAADFTEATTDHYKNRVKR